MVNPKTEASNRQPKKGQTGISKTVETHVPPDVLYRAVSTADGLRGWWSDELTNEGGTGGILTLHYRGGPITRVRFAGGEAPLRAEWDVIEHRPLSEWNGTKLVFTIERLGRSISKLRFRHIGLDSGCECYGMCNRGWSYYMESLRDFVESGKGKPGQ